MKKWIRAGILSAVILFGAAGYTGMGIAAETEHTIQTEITELSGSGTETERQSEQLPLPEEEQRPSGDAGSGSSQESEKTEETVTVPTPTAKKAGWLKKNGYRYYFKTKKTVTTGWKKLSGRYYYFRPQAEGDAPRGSMVTGFYTVNGKTFYFSKTGKLQTGWKKLKGKYYYFETKGKSGTIGAMYTGLVKIKGVDYLLDENGQALTGWQDYGENRYYANRNQQLGKRGALIKGWKTIDGYKYYFDANGVMQKNCWIILKKKYYVDENGRRLVSCVTPDGYIVNKKGARVRSAKGWILQEGKYYYYVSRKRVTGWKTIQGKNYYFDADGVRQSGWLTLEGNTYYLKDGVMQTGWRRIDGKKYYFGSDGKMQTGVTVDGISIDAAGIADAKPSVLLIAGHGMGDPGATSVIGKKSYHEEDYTRQFADLIEKHLKAAGDEIAVTMYDQNYDCYQVNKKFQYDDELIGPLPGWQAYDFILEVHFNATVEAVKDLEGNGEMKGVGIYVFPGRSQLALEQKIVAAIGKTGIPIWGRGTGVFARELLNARTCFAQDVPYALLETAFIDDKDDMKFYNKNKNKMAKAAASAILAYFR